ncbi:MAG: helix-turn-helix domain-containing protein [Planctomycetota bacterium]|jgi:AraC-like DNA-binding protein
MKKICAMVEATASWVGRTSVPRVRTATLYHSRVATDPTPLVGLLYLAAGEYPYWKDDRGERYQIREGELFWGCAHHGARTPEPEMDIQLWSVALNVENVPEFEDLQDCPMRGCVPVANRVAMEAAFLETARWYALRDQSHPLHLKAALLKLFALALDCFSGHQDTRTDSPIEAAQRFIAQEYRNAALSLATIADAVHLNQHHFGRTFKNALGTSPMQYVADLRMQHACNLLRETALRVKEVARESGFADALHFSRAFHKRIGQSPSDYRETKPQAPPRDHEMEKT